MVTTRKFFRTIIEVEVLSEDAPISDDASLADVAYLIADGDCSGRVTVAARVELSAAEAAAGLVRQGSDPEFFGIDETGEDIRL